VLNLPLTKIVADVLTASRFLLALYLACLGILFGPMGLPRAMVALVSAWVTDLLDGTFARMRPVHRQTWVGARDLAADVSVAAGLLCYLTAAGFVSGVVALVYAAVVGGALWLTSSRALAMGGQAPVYLLALIAAFEAAPSYFALAAFWILLVVVVTWPRFPKQVIPDFLGELGHLLKPRR